MQTLFYLSIHYFSECLIQIKHNCIAIVRKTFISSVSFIHTIFITYCTLELHLNKTNYTDTFRMPN